MTTAGRIDPVGWVRFAALALSLLCASCSQPPDHMKPIPDAQTIPYRLGPGDAVRVITVGEEAASGQFRVGVDGSLDLPLIGPTPVTGMTTADLALLIKNALHTRRQYRDPSVAVEIVAYRTLALIGEVLHPGVVSYQPGLTVLLAIANAGGFTYRSVDDRFSVRRVVDGHLIEGRAGPDTRLMPGDLVRVYERHY